MGKIISDSDEVNYYRVHDYIELKKSKFSLPYDITLVRFSNTDLSDPDSEPIATYHYAGSRRYLWQEKTWGVYHFSTYQHLQIRKLAERYVVESSQDEIEYFIHVLKFLEIVSDINFVTIALMRN